MRRARPPAEDCADIAGAREDPPKEDSGGDPSGSARGLPWLREQDTNTLESFLFVGLAKKPLPIAKLQLDPNIIEKGVFGNFSRAREAMSFGEACNTSSGALGISAGLASCT